MDIKKGRASSTAPTPNNTPSVAAPIASSSRPPFPKIEETAEGDDAAAPTTTSAAAAAGSTAAPAGSLFAPNTALVSALQHQLGSLAGHDDDSDDDDDDFGALLAQLPPVVRKRVTGLKGIQAKHTALEAKFHLEVFELEKKYQALFEPLYERRLEIIHGKSEPTDEEMTEGARIDEADGVIAPETEEQDEAEDVKGVPDFWLTVMQNHRALCTMITEKDEAALKHLTNIQIVYCNDRPGFEIHFHFSENEFFEDAVLIKRYFYQQGENMGDLVYESAQGHDIKWKAGKDLSVMLRTKKQRNKATKQVRTITKAVPQPTFFTFFKVPTLPDLESDDEDEEVALQDALDADYEMGEVFKEQLVPHAIDWFTGKALSYEDMSGSEGYDSDDFEESDFDSE